MESNAVNQVIELIVRELEGLGLAVIAFASLYATVRGLLQIRQRKPDAYQRLIVFNGKALQRGLEFLVAANLIRAVTVAPTRDGMVSLGLLIVARTFLSWSTTMEIEGRWPWQVTRSGRA